MPTMSAGSMSLVNWIRRKDSPRTPGQRPGQQGLAYARHVLDQQVAAGQQAGEFQANATVLCKLPQVAAAVEIFWLANFRC